MIASCSASDCGRTLHNIILLYRLCLDFPDVDSESLDHFGEYILKCVPAQSLKLSFPLVSRRKLRCGAHMYVTLLHLKDMVLRRTLFTGVIYVALKKNSAQVKCSL